MDNRLFIIIIVVLVTLLAYFSYQKLIEIECETLDPDYCEVDEDCIWADWEGCFIGGRLYWEKCVDKSQHCSDECWSGIQRECVNNKCDIICISKAALTQKISIYEPKSGAISVMNNGTKPINTEMLAIYIDRTFQTCNWSASVVVPGEVITADCTCTEGQIIRVTTPSNVDTETCVIK